MFNFDLMRIINMCIPLISMVNECYRGRDVNTADFFNTALNSIGMGHQKRAKRATDLVCICLLFNWNMDILFYMKLHKSFYSFFVCMFYSFFLI